MTDGAPLPAPNLVREEYRHIEVAPISGALGAEISGVDLSTELSADVVDEIRRAWLAHLVVFFRDQPLANDRFLAFARRIGEPGRYPFVPGLAEFPEIIAVTKLPHETVNFGGIWHSDTAYLEEPPSGTMLLAREIPPAGGDTLFANQYLAYEQLSEGMKKTLEGLRLVSRSDNKDTAETRAARVKESGVKLNKESLTGCHPVIRTHPETARKSLYISPGHSSYFEGWSEAESAALLGYLHHHQITEEFRCRHIWQVGDLALWDNRCVLHYPVNDYHGYRRLLHRITLKGDIPT